jgi:hypothetical protein
LFAAIRAGLGLLGTCGVNYASWAIVDNTAANSLAIIMKPTSLKTNHSGYYDFFLICES